MVAQRDILESRLSSVSYYRLSGYWHPFRQDDPNCAGGKLDTFILGASFDSVWARYRFDRKLRFLLMDAIERIEIAIRTKLVLYFTQSYGPFAYADEKLFGKWREHKSTIKKFEKHAGFKPRGTKPRHIFVKHFVQKYQNAHLPFWMMAELLDFGAMTLFIRHFDKALKKRLADDFHLPYDVLDSWLTSLNTLRNACAHHSRVWNTVWGTKPLYPSYPRQKTWRYVFSKQEQAWIDPGQRRANEEKIVCAFDQRKTAILLAICSHLQKVIAPQSSWKNRVEELFDAFAQEDIPLYSIGLHHAWRTHPLWIGASEL